MTEILMAAPPMRPGTYIRKRREAAGQTLDQVVSWFADDGSGITRGELMTQLRALESGTAPAKALSAEPLKGAFPFDPDVYLALVFLASGAKVALPPICRVCACSEFDACIDDVFGGTCAWAPLCTHCQGEDPGPAVSLSDPAAADEQEMRHAA
jgi:hypothetical protein